MKTMTRLLVLLLGLTLSAAVHAQAVGIIINQTPVIGGTTGQCLTITSGKITSGTCTPGGGLVLGANGGTGVANIGKTITLGASLITTGAGIPTLAFPATAKSYSFPSLGSGDVVLTNSTKGAMSETVVVQDALYTAGLQMISLAKNTLTTYGGNQWGVYYNASLVPQFFKRNLTTGVVTKYTPSLPASVDNDVHRVAAMAIDKNGFIHLAYAMHNTALIYYRSNSAEDASAFTARTMLGTNEDSLTYPMFMKSPITTELYFTARNGHQGFGITLFYHYAAGTTSWEAATGTTAGILFNGQSEGTSTYLNGLPKWDSSGNLWWQWTLSRDDALAFNQYLVKWNGTSFFKFSGAAQTIPAAQSNLTPVMTISTATVLSPESDFAVSTGNVFTIGYMRNDASGNMQVYAGESSTGSFVEHQLTNNLNPTGIAGSINPTVVISGAFTYVLLSDVFSKERGIVAYQSGDNYTTFKKFYPVPNFNPNAVVNADPQRLDTGVVSFQIVDANEPSYGASYVYASAFNADLGKLSVIDWTPSIDVGASKGTPADLYGLNVVGAVNGYFTNFATSTLQSPVAYFGPYSSDSSAADAVVKITGTAPASVVGNGTAALPTLTIAGVVGGATSSTGTNTAGGGSTVSVTTGPGGPATGVGTSVGGKGGDWSIITGPGGAGTAGNNGGGNGGDINLTTGGGGSKTGSGVAGARGLITLTALRTKILANTGATALEINQIGGGESLKFTGAGPASGSISTDGASIYLQPNGVTVISALAGGAVSFGTASVTLTANAVGFTKTTASGTAPGAGAAKMEWVAGTNSGTCKLVGYAGTSGTAVTIVDNVGGSC